MTDIKRKSRFGPLIKCQVLGPLRDLGELLLEAVARSVFSALPSTSPPIDRKGGPKGGVPPKRSAARDLGPPKPDRYPGVSKKGPAAAEKGAP